MEFHHRPQSCARQNVGHMQNDPNINSNIPSPPGIKRTAIILFRRIFQGFQHKFKGLKNRYHFPAFSRQNLFSGVLQEETLFFYVTLIDTLGIQCIMVNTLVTVNTVQPWYPGLWHILNNIILQTWFSWSCLVQILDVLSTFLS